MVFYPSRAARLGVFVGWCPDPIHAWDAELAVALLRADPDRQLGAALLDQRIVAGMGSIFRSETLFAARLSPFVTVGELDDAALTRGVDHAAALLQANAPRAGGAGFRPGRDRRAR